MSIATELQRIVDTKKDLRKALNIDDSVPFSQYAAHIPWHGETPPASTRFFDFVGNRYSAGGAPAPLSSLGSTFTRLSSATQWKDGVLVDVATNVMRLDKAKGLLIEPQRTNSTSLMSPIPETSTEYGWSGGQPASKINNGVRVTPVVGSNGLYYKNHYINPNEVLISSMYILSDRDETIRFSNSSTDAQYESLTANTLKRVSRPVMVSSELRFMYFGAFLNDTHSTDLFCAQLENGITVTSYIPTTYSRDRLAVTRSKDTLVVPFETGQTVTADKDEGVTMTIIGLNAVFEGHGHLRYIWVD